MATRLVVRTGKKGSTVPYSKDERKGWRLDPLSVGRRWGSLPVAGSCRTAGRCGRIGGISGAVGRDEEGSGGRGGIVFVELIGAR